MSAIDIVDCIGANNIVFGCLVAAVIIVLWICNERLPDSGIIIGKAKFEIKSSWISNTTLFSALLVSALKDNFIPKPGTINWLGGLNLLFAALAIFAILIYFASERTRLVPAEGDAKQASKEEYSYAVRAYVVAAMVALWAAGGQLTTLWATVSIADEEYLPFAGKLIFVWSITLAAIALIVYARETIRFQLKAQATHQAAWRAAEERASEQKQGRTEKPHTVQPGPPATAEDHVHASYVAPEWTTL